MSNWEISSNFSGPLDCSISIFPGIFLIVCLNVIMEDWQQQSLEETNDIDNLLTIPSISYSSVIYKPSQNDTKAEKIEQLSSTFVLKQYKCNVCDYETELEADIKRHVASVHEESKPFRCNICEYKGGQKSDLKKHMSVHKIKPEYKVDILGHILSRSSVKHEQVEIDPSLI